MHQTQTIWKFGFGSCLVTILLHWRLFRIEMAVLLIKDLPTERKTVEMFDVEIRFRYSRIVDSW